MAIAVGKLVDLLEKDNPPEVRWSALTILGELGGRDAAISRAVMTALEDDDAELRLRAVRAAGRLRLEKALPRLGERLRAGGAEGEAAAESAAQMGKKGIAMLRDLMGHVVPGLRRYIAAALARAGATGDGNELDVLADKDAAAVDAAVTALTALIPTLSDKQRKRLADTLIRLGSGRKTKLSPASEAGIMRLAGLLDDARVAPLLWDRVLPPHPAEARANALQSLGKLVTTPGKSERESLFRCAAEADFRIAAPALMMLDRLPASEKLAGEWVKLLSAPDIAARRVAMSKVGDRDDKAVVEALREQVRHPDQGYRQEVFAHLGKTERGRQALSSLLKESASSDDAWALAKVLVPFAKAKPDDWQDELFPVATAYIEAGDQRANPVLFVLRESSVAGLRDRLDRRAQALVKKKDFETAALVYRTLSRDPAIGFPIRLGIALCGLKVSPKELDESARNQDPCLHHFGTVAAEDQAKVLSALSRTAWLDADDLYYLGFHFAESTGALRDFGGEVLRLLIKKYPRAKVAASAKNKLKSVQ